MQRRTLLSAAGAGMLATMAGCLGDGGGSGSIRDATLRVTTATTPYDAGLLDALNAAFTDRFGAAVDAVAQGTGAALRTAEDGDADAVIVHARPLEDEFLRAGYGINRRTLMFNDFVVVGAPSDPADVAEAEDVAAAFARIAGAEATFVSRGDTSGTHVREREIWEAADATPTGDWYRAVGTGMGQVLTHTSLESGAYTLTDRGTYLSMRGDLDLVMLLAGPMEGGPALLRNPYGILAVNPARHEHVAYDLAMAYIGFLTSVAGQAIIEDFTVDGDPLYLPRALADDPGFAQYVPEGWRPDG